MNFTSVGELHENQICDLCRKLQYFIIILFNYTQLQKKRTTYMRLL